MTWLAFVAAVGRGQSWGGPATDFPWIGIGWFIILLGAFFDCMVGN